jgi:hypothetical protein
MNHLRTTLIWLNYCFKWIFSHRRFVAITPPFLKTQICYDRASKQKLQIHVRDSDDWIQFEHIFLNEEFNLDKTARAQQIRALHQRLRDCGQMPLIVDLGANIGLASKYFDLVYPLSKILAVEPEAENCRIARLNLPKQVTVVQAAISSEAGKGRLIDTGRHCAFRVLPDVDGNAGGGGGSSTLLLSRNCLIQPRTASPF